MRSLVRLRRHILEWYRAHQRLLPWRRSQDPYRIWVSEIMLQQTRVGAVLPYYERFLNAFPDVETLAAASEDKVLAMWAGLGYYARARNLLKAARLIASQGEFPRTAAGWRALPGVGEYTAAAVASIAFGEPVAVLDGNVKRVLIRLTADEDDPREGAVTARLKDLASRLLDPESPGEFNQALMELGATVCLPRTPQCAVCPCRKGCRAFREGRQQDLPVPTARSPQQRVQKRLLLALREGKILLRRRADKDRRMAGFWELPEGDIAQEREKGEILARFRHQIVNHTFEVLVSRAAASDPLEGSWHELSHLSQIPLASMTRKALRLAGICCAATSAAAAAAKA